MRILSKALLVTLPLAAAGLPTAGAAGVDPLPAVARALSGVTSYQVTITSSVSGRPRRPSGSSRPGNGQRNGRGPGNRFGFGFGPQTRVITAVRKGDGFEDDIATTGKLQSGKTATMHVITYGATICMRATGATSYSCTTPNNRFFNPDPTHAFTQGAGSTVFARTQPKTIGGQVCYGYTYSNVSQSSAVRGSVYISRKTNLPCEQIDTVTRHFGTSGQAFTSSATYVWSHFNDKHLKVPSIPGL